MQEPQGYAFNYDAHNRDSPFTPFDSYDPYFRWAIYMGVRLDQTALGLYGVLYYFWCFGIDLDATYMHGNGAWTLLLVGFHMDFFFPHLALAIIAFTPICTYNCDAGTYIVGTLAFLSKRGHLLWNMPWVLH
jgi:hypothetical protein